MNPAPDPASLLRPPRGPVDLPDPWAWVPWALLGLALAALLAVPLVMLLRRRRATLPPPTPDERALAALAALPPGAGSAPAALEALRGWLEDRHGVPARAATDEELDAALSRSASVPAAVADGVRALLAEAVAARYAPFAAGDAGADLPARAAAIIRAAAVTAGQPDAEGGPR